MRTTLAQAKASRIAPAIGMCPTDSRFIAILNEAQHRLLLKGKWWGAYARYRICVNSQCLTWPRQVAAIEAISIDQFPIKMRNEWFEYLEAGYGLKTTDQRDMEMFDRGTAVTFDDICPGDKKLRIYIDDPDDAGKTITVSGYDDYNNWILTEDGEVDGETITLAYPYVDSTHEFSAITGVVKDATQGVVRLYELDTDTLAIRPLAYYEPDETTPVYRRSFLPYLGNTTDTDCGKYTIDAMVKLEYIPAAKDKDFLLISNLPALKEGCMAVVFEEKGELDKAMLHEARAVQLLEEELRHYRGDGAVLALRVDKDFGGGGVLNIV